MAISVINNNKMVLHHALMSASTDSTGNIVLGTDYNNRIIINIVPQNNLICWSFGYANNGVRMIHFTDYAGNTLVNTPVIMRLYWVEYSQFVLKEET